MATPWIVRFSATRAPACARSCHANAGRVRLLHARAHPAARTRIRCTHLVLDSVALLCEHDVAACTRHEPSSEAKFEYDPLASHPRIKSTLIGRGVGGPEPDHTFRGRDVLLLIRRVPRVPEAWSLLLVSQMAHRCDSHNRSSKGACCVRARTFFETNNKTKLPNTFFVVEPFFFRATPLSCDEILFYSLNPFYWR